MEPPVEVAAQIAEKILADMPVPPAVVPEPESPYAKMIADRVSKGVALPQTSLPVVTVTAGSPVQAVAAVPQIVVTGAVRIADIIEKTAQPFAGCLGHVIVVEQDSVVCVQQPSQASSLTWFRVQNSHFRIVGRAVGRYKIPPDEIQRRIDALKPVKVNLDNFDEPTVSG